METSKVRAVKTYFDLPHKLVDSRAFFLSSFEVAMI